MRFIIMLAGAFMKIAKLTRRFLDFSKKVQKASVVRAIRDGLATLIPIFIIGAFALAQKFFPVPATKVLSKRSGRG